MSMDAGLVGHWKFNEKSGIIANDSSRYRNTGTLVGATHLPVWSEKGIKFDGVDDYVNTGNNASLNITSEITIEAWVKTTQTGEKAIVFKSFNDNVAPNYGNLYRLILNVNVAQVLIINSNRTLYQVKGNVPINDNNWHFVVGVFDSNINKLRLYVDGSQDGSDLTTTGIIGTSTQPVSIGANIAPGGSQVMLFNGSIDEVRIYNRALSANEIKRHYDSTKHNYI